MKGIGDLVQSSLRRHGIEKQVTAARVVEEANRCLSNLLLSPAKKDAYATSYFGDRLSVTCRHAIAAQSVRHVQSDLLQWLAHSFPNKTIREVEVRIHSSFFEEGRR